MLRSDRSENLRFSLSVLFQLPTLDCYFLLIAILPPAAATATLGPPPPLAIVFGPFCFLALVLCSCVSCLFCHENIRGSDRTVKFWDMAAKECVHTFDSAHSNQVPFVLFCLLLYPAQVPDPSVTNYYFSSHMLLFPQF